MISVMRKGISSSSQVTSGSYSNPPDWCLHHRLSASVEGPLLDDTGDDSQHGSDDRWGTPRSISVSVGELLKSRELRRPLVVGSFAMIAQQLSGMIDFLFPFSLVLIPNTGINASTGSGMLYQLVLISESSLL
jgi:hypothetical protein